jgi:serine/threonine protein kinase
VDTFIGSVIGGYTIKRLLGSGGMGAVYLAEDPAIGQQVAIKILRSEGSDLSDPQQALERFKQEARALASLDHLHILPLYRYGEEETPAGRRAYMVMQYRPEGSLWDWLRRRAGMASQDSLQQAPALPAGLPTIWPLSLSEAEDYLRQAASALQYAHEHGIIHRDIKPANFLLRIEAGPRVHLLLSDFGLARLFASGSATGQIFGTPLYMAPEQFDGEARPESDQYALAIMIYLLLTGRTPFEGDPLQLMHQHLSKEPPPIRTFNPALPEALEAVFARALAKAPEQRFPSVSAFAAAFDQAVRSSAFTPGSRLRLPAQEASGAASEPTVAMSATSLPTTPGPAEPTRPATPDIDHLRLPRSGLRIPSSHSGSMTAQRQLQQADAAPTAPGLPPLPTTPQPPMAIGIPGPTRQESWQSPPTPFIAPPTAALPPDAVPPAIPGGLALPSAPGAPGNRPAQKISRRRVLALAAAGVLVAGVAAGGAGLYFYLSNRQPAQALAVLRGHQDSVTSLTWSPDGRLLASGSLDQTARLWSIGSKDTLILSYSRQATPILSIAWSEDGTLLASGGENHSVTVWTPDGTVRQTFSDLGAPVSALTWTRQRDLLLAGTLGNGAHALLLNGQASHSLLKVRIRAFALSPAGDRLAVALESGIVSIINLATRRIQQSYHRHRGAALAVAWSPDGRLLASGGADHQVVVWESSSGLVQQRLNHPASVNGLAWDPGTAARLATACSDERVRVWTLGSHGAPAWATVYSGHQGSVTAVAWGRAGLASASTDHTIILWRLPGSAGTS